MYVATVLTVPTPTVPVRPNLTITQLNPRFTFVLIWGRLDLSKILTSKNMDYDNSYSNFAEKVGGAKPPLLLFPVATPMMNYL